MNGDDTPGTRVARARAERYRQPWYREETLRRPNWQWAVLATIAVAVNLIAYMMK
jgi:hypothetical protein